jgi:hypothetical protein
MSYWYRTALHFTVLPSFENWKAFLEKKPTGYAYEIPLYSDATLGFFDRLSAGPYHFLRSSPSNTCEEPFRTVMVMRVNVHIRQEGFESLADLEKTDDSAYHGGDPDDEIAALLSLLLGIRLMKGSVTREFDSRYDPRGTPVDSGTVPALVMNSWQAIIPRLQRTEDLRQLPELFNTYPTLEPAEALVLIKSARLYQQAIWYADTDPNQAWLMLVSAIETAADHWWRKDSTPAEILKDSNKLLYDLLIQEGGQSLAEKVAKLVANVLGASRKFREFVLNFLPGPPEKRPSPIGQFPFEDKAKLEEAMKKIYDYRSKALHGGKPFPAPMCLPPGWYGGDEAKSEIPTGQASGTLGATWLHGDTPMMLHTFEYIVRGCLMTWWRSMVKQCPVVSRAD